MATLEWSFAMTVGKFYSSTWNTYVSNPGHSSIMVLGNLNS